MSLQYEALAKIPLGSSPDSLQSVQYVTQTANTQVIVVASSSSSLSNVTLTTDIKPVVKANTSQLLSNITQIAVGKETPNHLPYIKISNTVNVLLTTINSVTDITNTLIDENVGIVYNLSSSNSTPTVGSNIVTKGYVQKYAINNSVSLDFMSKTLITLDW